jgi:hypothetical protein
MRSTGTIYAVFKSAGRTRWKNLGTDELNHARELLAEEIKREVKVDWKQSRLVTLRRLIERYEGNPMNNSQHDIENSDHAACGFQTDMGLRTGHQSA